MRKLTCPPGAEVLGQIIVPYYDNLQGSDTRPIMEKYGLVDPDPTAWYPDQQLLNALNEMGEKANLSSSLVAIGMKIGEVVPAPPNTEDPSLEQMLAFWDTIYQSLHRNADMGCIRYEKVADKHYKTTHNDKYPDDLSYGILYAFGRRCLPKGTQFMVYYDEDFPGRDYGGTTDETIIHIKWD